MSQPEVMTVHAESEGTTPLVGRGEPIDLALYIQRRTNLIGAWAAWDAEPGNAARANAFVDACIAYAGKSNIAFAKFIAAVRRGGGNPESALDAWEKDW